jgi:hypothetical protein
MNERTKELIAQCTYQVYDSNQTLYDKFDKEKFAELIVRECTNVVLHYADVDEGVAVAKKRFGVE